MGKAWKKEKKKKITTEQQKSRKIRFLYRFVDLPYLRLTTYLYTASGDFSSFLSVFLAFPGHVGSGTLSLTQIVLGPKSSLRFFFLINRFIKKILEKINVRMKKKKKINSSEWDRTGGEEE